MDKTNNAATAKPGFVLYKDLEPILDKLTVPQCGHLMKAIFRYQNKGELSGLDPATDIAMTSVVSHFKRDNLKYEKTCVRRREAGSKGGKQKVANASKCKQRVANVAEIEIDTEIERGKDIEKKSIEESFSRCWVLFGRKGVRLKALDYWKKLPAADRAAVTAKIPAYVNSTPELKYRKNFEGWINPAKRMWEGEVFASQPEPTGPTMADLDMC
jgi:hypothetical protein